MGDIAIIAARSPHDEQGDAIEHPDALKPLFKIGFPFVFTSQQIAVKKFFQTGKVDAVVLEIFRLFRLIPGSYGLLYTHIAYAVILSG